MLPLNCLDSETTMPSAGSQHTYFSKLRIRNVRSFAGWQELDLTTGGKPAQWTLIVGDNGLGKTTLLQCLASMRPVATVANDAAGTEPDGVEPALALRADDELFSMARVGETEAELVAEFTSGNFSGPKRAVKTYSLEASIKVDDTDLIDLKCPFLEMGSPFEPLVITYGAARHQRYGTSVGRTSLPDAAESIYDASIELADPVEILEGLDYSAAKRQPGARDLLKRIKVALAQVIPGIARPTSIKLYGPAPPGSKTRKRGVQVETVFGEVPFRSLSLGYQTMTAWMIDLSWRLYQHYPLSPNPLREPAIVLIDELDLHLHPRWQRQLRQTIVETFPKIQFIATAHSPVLAQTYLGMNLAIVREENGRAVIESDPAVAKTWRLDEVITSALYEVDSAYSPEIAAGLKRRIDLRRKSRLEPSEKSELAGLDSLVESMAPKVGPDDESAMALIRDAAALIGNRPR